MTKKIESKLQKLKKLRKDHFKIQYDITLYPYQEAVSDRILEALVTNMEAIENATPEEIEELKQEEIAAEISRQAGKTTVVGLTCEFIMTYIPEIYDRPLKIVIFAPQLDQAKLSYNIIRDGTRKVKQMFDLSAEEDKSIREQENARKLVVPNGSSAVVAPLNKISQIEGLSADLIIIDESQLADDEIVKHKVWPMGKTTNAPRVYIGKAGTQKCHFHDLSQNNKTMKYYFDDVAPQRREVYEETQDPKHLIYEQSVKQDIEEYGKDSDYIQREYYGKWQIGTGQFVTAEALDRLVTDSSPTYHYKSGPCFAGIDTAKAPDSTVVTVIRKSEKDEPKKLLNWLELSGDNYQDQFDIIQNFLDKYQVEAIAIDSTGQGDFMPDMFERHSKWQDENSGLYRVKFSAPTKDMMYKNLKVSIREFLTELPKLSTKSGKRFRQQMLDLEQQYKGQLLSVHHPDHPEAHDDYPDSWALAEWAYAKYVQEEVGVASIGADDEVKNPSDWDNDFDW